ncbi:hypothetical protein BCAR13_530008 [Paraburkholderia caribensis]|nr:hypothetical protein BCAR13_530008 [Paraburkholderia caribensis]
MAFGMVVMRLRRVALVHCRTGFGAAGGGAFSRRGRPVRRASRVRIACEARPHEADMLAQHIELIRIRKRHLQTVDRFLDLVQPHDERLALGRRRLVERLALDRDQRAVPAVDARLHAPRIQRRHEPQPRNQHDDDRHQHDQQPVREARQPERQHPVQEALARLVVAGGVLADREVVRERRGKFARPLQRRRLAVHFVRRIDQQIRQRRMQRIARDQFGRRRDHVQRGRRQVFAEIERAHRHFELRQIREAFRVGGGLREVVELHARRAIQLAHHGRLRGVARQDRRVDLAFRQRFGCVVAGQRQQLRRAVGGDAVRLQQLQRELARAAAFGADRDALALELRQQRDHRPAIEDRHGHIRDAAERHQIVSCFGRRDAVLDEADVDVRVRVGQSPVIVQRAFRLQHVERDTVAREDFLVLLRGDPEGAALGAGRHRQRVGRGGLNQPHGDVDRYCADYQDGAERYGEIAPGDRHEAGDEVGRFALRGAFRAMSVGRLHGNACAVG